MSLNVKKKLLGLAVMWISLQALMFKILQRVYKSVFFVISLGEGVDEVWLDNLSANGAWKKYIK